MPAGGCGGPHGASGGDVGGPLDDPYVADSDSYSYVEFGRWCKHD